MIADGAHDQGDLIVGHAKPAQYQHRNERAGLSVHLAMDQVPAIVAIAGNGRQMA